MNVKRIALIVFGEKELILSITINKHSRKPHFGLFLCRFWCGKNIDYETRATCEIINK